MISKQQKVSIIVPCYNEENNIIKLFDKIQSTTKDLLEEYIFEIIFVDDGSNDNTLHEITKIADKYSYIKGISLSRNFGSHISISAGIENVKISDCVIVICADLQEPPELIAEILKKWREGFEVVWTIRNKRSQNFISKFFSKIFYSLFLKFSDLKDYPKEGPASFFLLDKKVYSNWSRFKERNRMVLGMISWMGFKQTYIKYKQNERVNGKSSFTFFKLLKLAIDSFVGYSYVPIRFISTIGIVISFLSFILLMYLIFEKIVFNVAMIGWTSLMIAILFLGGVQLITLGILGEYIFRGVEESRNRPLYLISKKINFKD